ncbi:hypothetical protein ABT297_42695 [Dactylosporangium sp. NPDC000555]|uniref:hypothetical protein n=1 Tax=Dactylosporangium sp. NPDC000555 TaxID=3154260 RepID=UPI003321E53F
MFQSFDRHRSRREQLLAGVSARLRGLGIEAAFGTLVPYYDLYGSAPGGLTGLVVHEPTGAGRMQVTAVAARRTVPPGEGGLSADRRTWVRDVDLEYDLDGDVVFEVTILEGPGDGPGDPPAVWAPRLLVRDEEAVVDAVRLWHGYRDTLRGTPPAADPDRRRAALARQIAARHAAAADARVRLAVDASAVPPQQRPALAEHLAELDHAQLCFHFPRDRFGRYVKSAVVALAGYEAGLSKRGPWLAVRADGDELAVGVEALIGANQDHRWDRLPWLWSAAHRDATAVRRWQVPDAEHARPVVALLERHALADALTLCGVDVDAELASLLAGYPISYRHAQYTDTWVKTLYGQLRDCAPWRLAAAYRVWQDERRAARRPAAEPIALFGLKGLNQQAKPMVAVESRDGVCRLRMIWSGSNARLTRALWECPADLNAELLTPGTT